MNQKVKIILLVDTFGNNKGDIVTTSNFDRMGNALFYDDMGRWCCIPRYEYVIISIKEDVGKILDIVKRHL
jgi:hypothetical protein